MHLEHVFIVKAQNPVHLRVPPNTSRAMGSFPANNFTMELQQMDVDGSAGRAERSKWLLTSPDPPAPWQELFSSIKESVLPRADRNKKPGPNQFVFVLQGLFPILKWAKNYKATKFKNDVMAGLTLASLCIPQSIGYANLAKLDPQYGLCK